MNGESTSNRRGGSRRWLLACLMLVIGAAQAQVAQDDAVVARLRAEGVAHETGRVVLWTPAGAFTDAEVGALAEAFDQGVAAIADLLGTGLDTAHYAEDKIHVFVSPAVDVSHVYGGYRHMAYDKPYLFLNVRQVRQGRAPYLHELTHLLAWRFGSHSLREGLASHVELELAGRGAGRASGLFGMTDAAHAEQQARTLLAGELGQRLLPLIGRNGAPDGTVTSTADMASREAYYVLSQSFVRHLIAGLGLAEFLAVYGDADPQAALHARSGKRLEEWREAWAAQPGG